MSNKLKRGMYVSLKGIEVGSDLELKIIDAFVAAGAEKSEGRDCNFKSEMYESYKYFGWSQHGTWFSDDPATMFLEQVSVDYVLGSVTEEPVSAPSPIKRGMYLETKNIPDTETWKKVIDAFVKSGANHFEGYGDGCGFDYTAKWRDWKYVGIQQDGDIYHYAADIYTGNHNEGSELVSLEYVLSIIQATPVASCIDSQGTLASNEGKGSLNEQNVSTASVEPLNGIHVKAKINFTITFRGVIFENVTSKEVSELIDKLEGVNYE